MKVVEKFVSINGEGPSAGELAVFIRFKGCNLSCSYCDTSWANTVDCPYTEETPEEIFGYIADTGIINVTLTGGEPLLQDDIEDLIKLLSAQKDIMTEIETNGSVSLKPFSAGARPVFTMDYKLPSSGCENKMNTDNFSLLGKDDTVKFVIGSEKDMERALEIIRKYDLADRCHVYFSSVFGSADPAGIVEFMKNNKLNKVRLQLQMHKYIWDPEMKGV